MTGTDPTYVSSMEHFESMTHEEIYARTQQIDAGAILRASVTWLEAAGTLTTSMPLTRASVDRVMNSMEWEGATADAAYASARSFAASVDELAGVLGQVGARLGAVAAAAEAVKVAVVPPGDSGPVGAIARLLESARIIDAQLTQELLRQEALLAMNLVYKPAYQAAGDGVPALPAPPPLPGGSSALPNGAVPEWDSAPSEDGGSEPVPESYGEEGAWPSEPEPGPEGQQPEGVEPEGRAPSDPDGQVPEDSGPGAQTPGGTGPDGQIPGDSGPGAQAPADPGPGAPTDPAPTPPPTGGSATPEPAPSLTPEPAPTPSPAPAPSPESSAPAPSPAPVPAPPTEQTTPPPPPAPAPPPSGSGDPTLSDPDGQPGITGPVPEGGAVTPPPGTTTEQPGVIPGS